MIVHASQARHSNSCFLANDATEVWVGEAPETVVGGIRRIRCCCRNKRLSCKQTKRITVLFSAKKDLK